MLLRYRFNLAIQLGIGAIFFLSATLVSTFVQTDAFSWLGAGMIGLAGFIIAGYRIRGPISNVCIIVGHPDPACDRLNHQLADAYQEGAESNDYSVRRHNLGQMSFDPTLHDGYRTIQELEPDLQQLQNDVEWADHVVVFYPNWWSSMPAPLKGLFDRMWLPGTCFDFHKIGWSKLLKGRTGRVIVTMDNMALLAYLLFGDYTNEIQNGVLEFAGIQPTDVTRVSGLKFRSERSIRHEITRLYRMGRRAL